MNNNDALQFWEGRANNKANSTNFVHSLGNLTKDSSLAQEKHIAEFKQLSLVLSSLDLPHSLSSLDLGAGTCQWAPLLRRFTQNVYAVDPSESMLSVGNKFVQESGLSNISFYPYSLTDIKEFPVSPALSFVSGVFLYMDDNLMNLLLTQIYKLSASNSFLVLREPIGINGDYSIDNKYSSELDCNYSAFYRSQQRLIDSISENGFKIHQSIQMHENGSKFNKWHETILKVFVFKKL